MKSYVVWSVASFIIIVLIGEEVGHKHRTLHRTVFGVVRVYAKM